MKKISFYPVFPPEHIFGNYPSASAKLIPGWYKKMPKHMDQSKNFYGKGTNLTVKGCVPFFDAISSGYMITLQNDLFIESEDDGSKRITWNNEVGPQVEVHPKEQIDKLMVPDNCDDQVFKFLSYWAVSLPKGYSGLITHPLNRNDLPFVLISGIVDMDSYNGTVNFPFFLKKSASGVIPAGTPIAQIIPFKREKWFAKINKFSQNFINKNLLKLKSKIINGYRDQDWTRKFYR